MKIKIFDKRIAGSAHELNEFYVASGDVFCNSRICASFSPGQVERDSSSPGLEALLDAVRQPQLGLLTTVSVLPISIPLLSMATGPLAHAVFRYGFGIELGSKILHGGTSIMPRQNQA